MRRVALLAALALTALPLPARAGAPGIWVPSYDVPASELQSMAAFREGVGYLVTVDSAVNLLRTSDDGATWQSWGVLRGGAFTVRYASRYDAWAYDEDGGFQVSHDGGKTWADGPGLPMKDSEQMHASDFDIARDGNGMVLAGTIQDAAKSTCIGLRGDAMFWSRDAGRHWRRFQLPDPPASTPGYAPFIHTVRAYSRDVGLALGTTEPGTCTSKGGGHNALWVTTDAGRSWRTVFSPPKGSDGLPVVGGRRPLLSAATYVAAHTILAGWSDGSVSLSHDDGRHFAPGSRLVTAPAAALDDPDEDWITDVAFLGPVGYVTQSGGAVWRSTDSGRTWVRETTLSPPGQEGEFVYGRTVPFDADHAITRMGNFADEVIQYRIP